jgi:hypothetical protein
MAAITYGSHAPAHGTTAEKTEKTKASKPGFFHRLWDAIAQARMNQAMREIRMHSHFLPEEYELAGNKISYKNEDELPFVRGL